MVTVATSIKGMEFLYSAQSAHEVSKASSEYICKVLNEHAYQLKDMEVWAIHEVDEYDNAYAYAIEQKFTNRKGIVTERKARRF